MSRPITALIVHGALRRRIFSDVALARIAAVTRLRITDREGPLNEAEAITLLADAEIGIGGWGTPFPSPGIVEHCPELRFWMHSAGSVTHMFGPHLEGHPLLIASCKPALADNVAEFVLGSTIYGARGAALDALRNRNNERYQTGGCLFGRTVGIIGASLIGRRVMRLLAGFPCRVLLYDPYVDDDEAKRLGATLERDLLRLCQCCEIISLHTPDIESTRGMLTGEHFQVMPDDAVFINTARGRCVDQSALEAELSKGRLYAFLDVTDPEPTPADSVLRSLPNVFLTSHIGGAVGQNLGCQVADDIERYVQGQAPLCVVTADMLDHVA